MNHRPPVFTIAGRAVSGLGAEAHFVEWALALPQHDNAALRCECGGRVTSLDAVRIFQVGAFDHDAACERLLRQAGIRVH